MRIMVVEDDAGLARGIATSLQTEGYSVDIVDNGEDAMAIAPLEPYGVIVLDLGLPDIDGLEVLRQLRSRGQTTPILILTARDRIDDRVDGLDRGADDYMSKPFHPRELHSRVRALARRASGLHDPVIRIGTLEYDRVTRTTMVSGAVIPLRRRELAVLEALLSRPNKLVAREQLIAEIFSYDDAVAPNALEVYVGRLRRKLGEMGPSVKTLRGLGYMIALD